MSQQAKKEVKKSPKRQIKTQKTNKSLKCSIFRFECGFASGKIWLAKFVFSFLRVRGYTVRARIEKEGKEEVAKDLRMSSNEREKGLREREEGGSDRTRRGLSFLV